MTDKARELFELSLNALELHCSDYWLAKPEAKSLSDEEIVQAYEDASFIGTMTAFVAGIRFAEKHHGIGGEDE